MSDNFINKNFLLLLILLEIRPHNHKFQLTVVIFNYSLSSHTELEYKLWNGNISLAWKITTINIALKNEKWWTLVEKNKNNSYLIP